MLFKHTIKSLALGVIPLLASPSFVGCGAEDGALLEEEVALYEHALINEPKTLPAQHYMLGTFNMAGGHQGHGDNIDTAHELSQNIKDRAADIVFLQEACQAMTDTLREDLGPDWTVTFMAIPKSDKPGQVNPADYDTYYFSCKDHETDQPTASPFGLGIVFRSSFTVTQEPKLHDLPKKAGKEPRHMLCLDLATPQPLVACSTHLTAGKDKEKDKEGKDKETDEAKARKEEVEKINTLLSPENTAGNPVFLGGDFNTTPMAAALNPLWHVDYSGDAAGSFIEVDSGPSDEDGKEHFKRNSGAGTYGNGCFSFFGKCEKLDYIFVRGADVLNAKVAGESEYSDHLALWADVEIPALVIDDPWCVGDVDLCYINY